MAADKIRSYFRKRFEPLVERYPFQATYLPSFAFEDARFIIISTRFRGYKNIQRVVEAVNILVRKRQFNVKVLLTGYFDDQLEDFVKENCLYYDVIPLYHVPADIHAYLYFLSGLSIHPSFFEGGFPFVFSESLSLGTPCLLANVQTVTEVIDPSVDGDFLFDPYSATDIANKIQYAFEHSTQLEQRQQRLLSTMKERSWTDVADEYVTVFERASLIWNSGEFKSLVLEDRQALAEEAVKIHTAAGN
jgi:glycosyltransferase involved in cell wall biosynthesis